MSDTPRPTARDFDPEVLRLFDQYVHGDIDRRGFLSGTARIAGGMAAASGLLAMLAPQFAAAQQVQPDDPRIATSHLDFDSSDGNGKARGYLARPAKAEGKLPQPQRYAARPLPKPRSGKPVVGIDAARPLLEGLAAQLDLFGPELHAIVEPGTGDLDRRVDRRTNGEVAVGRDGGDGGAPLGQHGVDRRRHGDLEDLVVGVALAAAEPPAECDTCAGGRERDENEEKGNSDRGHVTQYETGV